MDPNKDYYKILGVDKNASEEEIKKQYKKLAVLYHPDKNKGDKQSEKKFKEINEAYQVLTKQKQKYDLDRNNDHGFRGFGGFGFDPFESFNINEIFNAFNNRYSSQQNYHENLDINYNLTITLEDVYNNRTIDIKYNRREPCYDCNGTGQDIKSSIKEKCKYCNNGRDSFGLPCQICGGLGNIYTQKCKVCSGEKVVSKEMHFSLNNIYKIDSDFKKYLKNYGHYSKFYKNKVGKLILNIKYEFDNNYVVSQRGLIKKINLHYEDAIKGNEYEFTHLDRK